MKTRSLKYRKIGMFSSRLVHGFREKLPVFSFFKDRENRPKNGV